MRTKNTTSRFLATFGASLRPHWILGLIGLILGGCGINHEPEAQVEMAPSGAIGYDEDMAEGFPADFASVESRAAIPPPPTSAADRRSQPLGSTEGPVPEAPGLLSSDSSINSMDMGKANGQDGLETGGIPEPLTELSRESYARINDNPFLRASMAPLSTFAVDVDTASYANIRRFLLRQNQLPPPDAVRIEELVNYFRYDDPAPSEGDPHPFNVSVEVARCPWKGDHRLARIGIKGRELDFETHRLSNLVFLIDVSGSMNSPDKLPLLKKAMRLMVDQLGENDTVSIAVYASAEGLVLPATSGDNKPAILTALERLIPGGSTAGAAGIQLAYKIATEQFIPGGINRVILCTDGDFNVGISDEGRLTRLIEDKAKSGVFLSVLGFGTGNYQDSKMEALADRGNGNYGYIDSLNEARKLLVDQIGGTLVTIAKDVKVQVDFNPAQVGAYRLIGYENRLLEAQDFNDDTKDAGEIGAGHSVTALYELMPPGLEGTVPDAPESKYVGQTSVPEGSTSDELMTVKLRYKEPEGVESTLIEIPITDSGHDYSEASPNFQFASSVALFGMLLRDSPYKGNATYNAVLELAQAGLGASDDGYRDEFLEIVKRARDLSTANP